MCEITIGSDTGGSTRAPASLCGIVGWKPSRQRVPTEGAFPLSFSLDSIGPMARTVAECALADAVMAGEQPRELVAAPLAGLRLGIPQGFPLDGLDDMVAAAWSDAVARLGRAGVRLSDEKIPLLDEMIQVNGKGGFAPAEAYAIHRERLKRRGDDVDPNVRARIDRGGSISAADYVDMEQTRRRLIAAMDARLADVDALVLPTTAIVAPRIDEVATVESFAPKNMLLLRNTSTMNFFDLCAISLPLPRGTGLPVGLMLAARNGRDRELFRIAAAVERMFAQ
jgi:aspartyl-tRNA(Asn)/glutamyl-tRNA(Gln) amidotransferase subunit A